MSKSVKTKIIALFISALLAVTVLAGCVKGGGETNNAETNNSEADNSETSGESGGNQGGEEAMLEQFTVTFISGGETDIKPQTVKKGEKIVKPADPEKTNYVFNGWFSGETEWNFETMTVSENVTLTAKWSAEFTPPYLPRGN